MNLVFGALALLGLELSVIVHGLSVFGIDVQSYVSKVWLLHIGVFVVFIPMVVQQNIDRSKENPVTIFTEPPAWLILTIVLLGAYVVVNFFVSLGPAMSEGDPVLYKGEWALVKKGKFIRHIDEAEFHARRASELRGFSGHWLLFYFGCFQHFWWRHKNKAPAQ